MGCTIGGGGSLSLFLAFHTTLFAFNLFLSYFDIPAIVHAAVGRREPRNATYTMDAARWDHMDNSETVHAIFHAKNCAPGASHALRSMYGSGDFGFWVSVSTEYLERLFSYPHLDWSHELQKY